MSNHVSEVFSLIADLCIARGEHPLNQYAGCWEHQVDDNWFVAVNGHREPRTSDTDGRGGVGKGFEVPGFSAVIGWNGWPAGIVDPAGGTMAAHPNGANEDTLIAALKAKIALLAAEDGEGK